MTGRAFSERRACRIVGLERSVQQYRPLPKDDAAAINLMKELTSENRRYLSPTEFLMNKTAPALEALAVSTLSLKIENQPEEARSNRPLLRGKVSAPMRGA